jgi:hypothetical protein
MAVDTKDTKDAKKRREQYLLRKWKGLIGSPQAEKARKELGPRLKDFKFCVRMIEELAEKDDHGDLRIHNENAYIAVIEEACLHMIEQGKTRGLESYMHRYYKLYRERDSKSLRKSSGQVEILPEDFKGEFKMTKQTLSRTEMAYKFLPQWREI